MKICQVCSDDSKEGKYKCPGCDMISCSLSCSRDHKIKTGCSGTRDKTKFISIQEYNESTFMNDICLLQGISRHLDDAEISQFGLKKSKLTTKQKLLQSHAKKTGIDLKIMSGLEKNSCNTSYFNKKLSKIFWRCEFVFACMQEVIPKLVVRAANEDEKILDIFKSALERRKSEDQEFVKLLTKLESIGDLSQPILIRKKEDSVVGDIQYFKFDSACSLVQALERTVVHEFPQFLVHLQPADISTLHIIEKKSPDIFISIDE